jgi:hypothetical protein
MLLKRSLCLPGLRTVIVFVAAGFYVRELRTGLGSCPKPADS